MPDPTFTARLQEVQHSRRSRLCVGLDPDPARLPPHLTEGASLADAILAFNKAIIEATFASACAFKLNFAFYEALGADGHRVLAGTLAHIPKDTLTIADAKRGDIGNSARFYAEAIFGRLGFDACTVAPYMGRDAVAPFLSYPGKAAFVLARTSNPSGETFQMMSCGGVPFYLFVAEQVQRWDHDAEGTAGLVAGATDGGALTMLRQACPALPFLIPGVGAQGGDAAAVIEATASGPILVNSSRQILYASDGEDFAVAAEHQAASLRAALQGEE